MIFKIFAHAIGLVVLLALASYFLGNGVIDAGIEHITGGLAEIGELAKKLGSDGTAGDLGRKISRFFNL